MFSVLFSYELRWIGIFAGRFEKIPTTSLHHFFPVASSISPTLSSASPLVNSLSPSPSETVAASCPLTPDCDLLCQSVSGLSETGQLFLPSTSCSNSILSIPNSSTSSCISATTASHCSTGSCDLHTNNIGIIGSNVNIEMKEMKEHDILSSTIPSTVDLDIDEFFGLVDEDDTQSLNSYNSNSSSLIVQPISKRMKYSSSPFKYQYSPSISPCSSQTSNYSNSSHVMTKSSTNTATSKHTKIKNKAKTKSSVKSSKHTSASSFQLKLSDYYQKH